ncbi:hypothetical protein GQ53DRAFT_756121 [Thozetella sp. PMI_491]|nr:hypothetical protein GQ53DRAFT_756121 [Thozetella sp. PMI_491]
MYNLRRATIFALSLSATIFVVWWLPNVLNPTPPTPKEQQRDKEWVDSSPYWLDRQACRWLSLCGIHHVKWDAPVLRWGGNSTSNEDHDLSWPDLRRRETWISERGHGASIRPETWWVAEERSKMARRAGGNDGAKILQEIPEYVLDHAPLVHLYTQESFWPSDIFDHIEHMTPKANNTAMNLTRPVDLGNLGQLNNASAEIFLTSNDDVESRPAWLHNHAGIPTPFEHYPDKVEEDHGDWGWRDDKLPPEGTTWWDADKQHPPHRIADPRRTGRKSSPLGRRQAYGSRPQHTMANSDPDSDPDSDPMHKPTAEGYSKAPVVLVIVEKGGGIVDAFWFFFYSYNLGQTVANIRFGNHVGDWEHCMVRFENGVPRAMFLSEHSGGQAYAWQALDKRIVKKGKPERPVVYSAVGSHAMYAKPGNHPYVLPFGWLKDQTDKGPLWDPSLNTYAYFYDYEQDREDKAAGREPTSLTPAASNPKLPTSWFHFKGWWGDDTFELRDRRQWRLFGQYHYVQGPTGPRFKRLWRHKVCQTNKCKMLYSLDDGSKSAWY